MKIKNNNFKKFTLLVLLLFSISIANGNAYLDFYQQRADKIASLVQNPPKKISSRIDPRFSVPALISGAYSCYLVGQKQNNAELKKLGLELYDQFLAKAPELRRDFHYSRIFGLMTLALEKNGDLTSERRAQAEALAKPFIKWYMERFTNKNYFNTTQYQNNISMAETAAVYALSKALSLDIEAQKQTNLISDRVLNLGDLDEDATNYSGLGMVHFVELLNAQGRLGELKKSANFQRFFARWRDTYSPAKMWPEFGDSYFKHQATAMDYVYLMELAARIYRDDSYKAAADSMYNSKFIDDDSAGRGYLLLELNDYIPSNSKSQLPISQITMRVDGEKLQDTFDKLIMKSTLDNGGSMAVLDLYSAGSHAHEFRRGAITYYEVDGVPLFHNLGRHGTRSANQGNVFLLGNSFEQFPYIPKPNVWQTMSIPVNRLRPTKYPNRWGMYKELQMRNFAQPLVKSITFDNLRLTGPKGTLLLDGMENDSTLKAQFPKMTVESVTDCTEGDFAQKINWGVIPNAVVVGWKTPGENRELNSDDYNMIKFDYKYEGPTPYFNLRGWCVKWIDFTNIASSCVVENAQVKQTGKNSFALVDFNDYMEKGNKLKREMALLDNGILIVVDSFTPSPDITMDTAGQLWQLYSLDESGADYFAAKSDGVYPNSEERRMLVKYWKYDGVEVQVEETNSSLLYSPKPDGTKYKSFFTTYSKIKLNGTTPVTMAQVIYPMTSKDVAKNVAAEINFQKLSDKLIVTIGDKKVEFNYNLPR